MIEFVVLAAIAAAAAAYIALPRGAEPPVAADDRVEELRVLRRGLLAELRELEDDAAAGRIGDEERADGRRAVGARLRVVTEALRARGEDLDARD